MLSTSFPDKKASPFQGCLSHFILSQRSSIVNILNKYEIFKKSRDWKKLVSDFCFSYMNMITPFIKRKLFFFTLNHIVA